MFNVHPVKGDTTKVLIEADIYTLFNFLAGYGETSHGSRKTLFDKWQLDTDTMNKMQDVEYDKIKTVLMLIYKKHMRSLGFDISDEIAEYLSYPDIKKIVKELNLDV